jgi:hypothetical protein
MVSSLNKWLFLLLPGSIFGLNEIENRNFPIQTYHRQENYHPFHVSVTEIEHNASDKTLEISCKLFTDDFENVLKQNYKTKVDLINPVDKAAMDTLVKKYITSHLSILADGKPVLLTYIGFERDNEAVYGYLQGDNITNPQKIDITNKLMYDLFTDQINLMHIKVGGKRKSIKLDYPAAMASFNF